jgi:excisionase family DNA binding protein
LFSDAAVIIGNQMNPKTVNVEEAGQILGIGRNSAYEAVRRGEIPVIKIGKLLRVPVVALERMLEEARPTPRDST